MTRKAQGDTGPLQTLMIGVVVVALLTVGALNFITSVGTGYDVSLSNESAFQAFEEPFSDVRNTTDSLADKLQDAEGGLDIITVMLTGGFSSLIDILLSIPDFLNSLIVQGLNVFGLGEYIAFFYVIVLIIVIFAIITVIMKVRA